MKNDNNLIDLNFRKYLMKINVLSYLYRKKIITEEIYEKSIVQIKESYNNKK